MTRNRVLCLVAIGSSALLGACGGGSQSAPPPATTAPATTAGSTTSAAAAVAPGDFGVPECDEYMKKYLACIETKVPDAGRAIMKQTLDQQKAAWKQAASTPEGRNGLALGCKAASDQTKMAVAAYGCSW